MTAALDWVGSLPPSPHDGAYTGLSDVVQVAKTAGQEQAVRSWIEANTDKPAAEALRTLVP